MQEKKPRKRRPRKKAPQNNYKPPFDDGVLNTPVNALSLRLPNTLELLVGAGIKKLGDLLVKEEKDLYKIHTFNKKNLFDVKNALSARNLHLKPAQSAQKDTQTKDKQKKDGSSKAKKDKRQKKPSAPKIPQDIYVKINKGGKWGFSDRSGKIVIAPVYDEVFNFKEDVCCVEKDELFGFIDRKGKEIVPAVYECALSFSEGLAMVCKNGKCGFIDKNNQTVIDFKYDAATSFENGSCRVKKDGKWGELKLSDPDTVRWIN